MCYMTLSPYLSPAVSSQNNYEVMDMLLLVTYTIKPYQYMCPHVSPPTAHQ